MIKNFSFLRCVWNDLSVILRNCFMYFKHYFKLFIYSTVNYLLFYLFNWLLFIFATVYLFFRQSSKFVCIFGSYCPN